MVKELPIKGKLHLFIFAITMKYYLNVAGVLTDDDTLPPILPPETISTNLIPTRVANTEPIVGPAAIPSTPINPPQAATARASDHPTLSFFMHDIFGGSAPSVRIVTGIIANSNTKIKGIPFSKRNRGVFFPKSRGAATANTVINSNGNNNLITNGKAFPFVTAGQLPHGAATLQKLLFGTVTVIDDELTEGHEFGSSIIGKAQGFYLASSMDGSSHTMAFTAMFHDDDDHDHDEDDAISFFGVHRAVALESPIAIVGGTGKYENAQGYAIIETLHHTNQYTTDGIDTLLQISVYITH